MWTKDNEGWSESKGQGENIIHSWKWVMTFGLCTCNLCCHLFPSWHYCPCRHIWGGNGTSQAVIPQTTPGKPKVDSQQVYIAPIPCQVPGPYSKWTWDWRWSRRDWRCEGLASTLECQGGVQLSWTSHLLLPIFAIICLHCSTTTLAKNVTEQRVRQSLPLPPGSTNQYCYPCLPNFWWPLYPWYWRKWCWNCSCANPRANWIGMCYPILQPCLQPEQKLQCDPLELVATEKATARFHVHLYVHLYVYNPKRSPC